MLLISYGTRPEWIKIKPLIEKIKGKIPYKTVFTGQHLDIVEKNTDYILKIHDGENRLNAIVTSILSYEHIFQNIDYVLVHGDTSSAFATALSAFHHQIPVIHLEAGLRTYDLQNPFSEELNRQMISKIAKINLCPTELNKQNLVSEKVTGDIFVTGNTGLDNLLHYQSKIEYNDEILITLHRRENHPIMGQWFKEISELATENPNLKFTIPLHPNPNVQMHKYLLKNVNVIDPISYNKMLEKLVKCRFLISDSGGIQEEASFLNKKVIVCRKITERPESLGQHSILCENPNNLKNLFDQVKTDYKINSKCPFGDGHASEKILQILTTKLKED